MIIMHIVKGEQNEGLFGDLRGQGCSNSILTLLVEDQYLEQALQLRVKTGSLW